MENDDLLEFFAGVAMLGIITRNDGLSRHEIDTAEVAYIYADAMIAERKRRAEIKKRGDA
jgi:hypothetical protein